MQLMQAQPIPAIPDPASHGSQPMPAQPLWSTGAWLCRALRVSASGHFILNLSSPGGLSAPNDE